MSDTLYKKFSLSMVASSVAFCLMVPLTHAVAQTSDKDANKIVAEETETITVTGTRMKGISGSDGALPEVILDKSYFLEIGAQNAFDAISSLPEMGMGGIDAQQFNPGSSGAIGSARAVGAASISLRDLGSDATLILINGRRIAAHPLLQHGSDVITNLNNLPIESIERIEILKAGASSIYGTDAMAGVINIIMRKDYQGYVATVDLGSSTENDGNKTRLAFTAGLTGLFGEDNNLTMSFEYAHQDALMGSDRESVSASLNAFPGGLSNTVYGDYIPGVGWERTITRQPLESDVACDAYTDDGECLSHLGKYGTIMPETERFNMNGSFFQAMDDDLEFFTDYLLSYSESHSLNSPNHVGEGGLMLPGDHPQNPFSTPAQLRYMILETGVRELNSETTNINVTSGFKGSFDWSADQVFDWELSLRYAQADSKAVKTGNVLKQEWNDAWRTGGYVFGDTAANSDALINSFVRNDLTRKGKNSTIELEGFVTGDWFNIADDAVTFALGFNATKNKISDTPDQRILDGLFMNEGQEEETDGARESGAIFAELMIPLFDERLELRGSGRQDWDEVFGTKFSPTVSVRFDLVPEQVILRASYAEGYRAPTLAEYDKPDSVFYNWAFFTPDVENLPCAVNPYPFPGFENYCHIDLVSSANLDLAPQTSENKNFGIILKPDVIDGLRVTVDYFEITRVDEIGRLNPSEIYEIFPENIIVNDAGEVYEIHDSLVNIGRTVNEGIDWAVSYSIESSLGLFSFSTSYSQTLSSTRQVNEHRDIVEYVGYSSKPEDRLNARINWRQDDWNASINYFYQGSTNINRYEGHTGICDAEDLGDYYTSCETPKYATYDLMVQYKGFDKLDLSLFVKNVTDELYQQNRVDFTPTKTGLGRYVNFVAKYTF